MRRASPPDIYIKPELSGIRLLHLDRVDAMIDKAVSAAGQLRKELESALSQ